MPREYTVEYELRREAGGKGTELVLIVDARCCYVHLAGMNDNKPGRSGLGRIDELPPENPKNPTSRLAPLIRDDEWNRVVCTVKPDAIKVTLNDEVIVDWTGDASRLSAHDQLEKSVSNHGLRLGLVQWDGRLTCRSAVLSSSELSPQAKGVSQVGMIPLPAVAPFDAAQAKAHQQAWANCLGTTIETTNSVGAKMILIPPGEFLMGSTDEQVEAALKMAESLDQPMKDRIQKTERPQHRIVITQPFLMSETEVTIGQFRKFVEAEKYVTEGEQYGFSDSAEKVLTDQVPDIKKPRNWQVPGHDVTDNSPVSQVTWYDAVAYCKWLSAREQITYRLPSEAEWEYACRAGTMTQFSFGDDVTSFDEYGWCNKKMIASQPVGQNLPNAFGLDDLHGNLAEWCQDFYDPNWYANTPTSDPSGPSPANSRVIRGGCMIDPAAACRSATRFSFPPSMRTYAVGFRLAATIDMAKLKEPSPIASSAAGSLTIADILTSPEYEWTEPVKLGQNVNANAYTNAPELFGDELTLWFAAGGQLWTSTRPDRLSEFGPCKLAKGPINDPGNFETGPALTVDGLTIVFVSTRPKHDGDLSLWIATRSSVSEPFGTPSKLDATVNSAKHDTSPALSADGLTLLFSSSRPGSLGGEDLWMATRATLQDDFKDARNLGSNINSAAHDQAPELSSDGLALLFASNRQGNTSLHLSTRANLDEPFGAPQQLDAVITTTHTETDPCLSHDGQTLYFSSARPSDSGKENLWMSRRVKKGTSSPAGSPSTGSIAPDKAPPLAIAPFDAAQAKHHQQVWADYLGVPVETTNRVGAKMILIPPGEFLMGASDAEHAELEKSPQSPKNLMSLFENERPQHRVRLTQPFYVGEFEVTNHEFKQFVTETNYLTTSEQVTPPQDNWRMNANASQAEKLPVVWVSWHDAVAYCDWLSQKEGRTYTLPTEAESEYLIRAGTQDIWAGPRETIKDRAWLESSQVRPVGGKLPNPFGLFDIQGNANEWCGESFGKYSASAVTDPDCGTDGEMRIIRGLNQNEFFSRPAKRGWVIHTTTKPDIGFRVLTRVAPTFPSAKH